MVCCGEVAGCLACLSAPGSSGCKCSCSRRPRNRLHRSVDTVDPCTRCTLFLNIHLRTRVGPGVFICSKEGQLDTSSGDLIRRFWDAPVGCRDTGSARFCQSARCCAAGARAAAAAEPPDPPCCKAPASPKSDDTQKVVLNPSPHRVPVLLHAPLASRVQKD